MSIEVVLEGTLESEKDFIGYCEMLQELSVKWQLKMEIFESNAVIDVCPEGFIEIGYEDTYLSISAQTNVAGPGFHAYVCDFFKAIVEASPMELQVSDPTNYYDNGNFEHLKTQVFHRWLKDIATYVQTSSENVEQLCISWPLDYYQPKAKEGFVITPMGYIAISDFTDLQVEQLADHFFVWNELGRNAKYYRNAALNLLWKECFYTYTNMNEYTEKITDTILDYLEIAHELDAELPIPYQEYMQLCEISGRTVKIESATSMYIQALGYRRNIIELRFGNWSIPCDGCCEKSIDDSNQTLYLMAPYEHAQQPWSWMIKANIYVFKQDVLSILPEIAKVEMVIERFEIDNDQIHGQAILEQKDDHLLLSAQLNCGNEMMLIQYIICDESQVDTLKEQMHQIKRRNYEDDKLKS